MRELKTKKQDQEVTEFRDWYAWDMLHFFIEFACMQGEITDEMHQLLTESLMRFKPMFDK